MLTTRGHRLWREDGNSILRWVPLEDRTLRSEKIGCRCLKEGL